MEIQIKVNWKKNRTWGLNPHASFYAFDGLYKGTASGCGFDKLSSAVAEALNKCVPLSLALLRNEESLKGVYGIRFFDHTSKKTGKTSRAVLWEGGVGINCFHQVIESWVEPSNMFPIRHGITSNGLCRIASFQSKRNKLLKRPNGESSFCLSY